MYGALALPERELTQPRHVTIRHLCRNAHIPGEPEANERSELLPGRHCAESGIASRSRRARRFHQADVLDKLGAWSRLELACLLP